MMTNDLRVCARRRPTARSGASTGRSRWPTLGPLVTYIPTMTGLDGHGTTASPNETQDDSDESITYIEISSTDHPEAFNLCSDGKTIRNATDIHDLFAEIAVALEPFFVDGDRTELLDFVFGVDEDGEMSDEAASALADYVNEHGDALTDGD